MVWEIEKKKVYFKNIFYDFATVIQISVKLGHILMDNNRSDDHK